MILTNYLGVAFAAMALSADDARITVVCQDDGSTNTIAWTQLSVPSQDAVCEKLKFAPVPPELAATFELTKRELVKLDALLADERIDKDAADTRRRSVRRAFSGKCRKHGVNELRTELLLRRLL